MKSMSKFSIIMTVILLSLTIAACKHDDTSEQNVFHNAVTDVDGNKYDAIKIGNRIWMKSNLRTTHFKDGTPIPKGKKSDYSSTDPYYYRPTALEVPSYNKKTFGLYYNWSAVYHYRGLCPEGWHVPSSIEWSGLANYMGHIPEFVYGSNSADIAKALASQTGWEESSEEGTPGHNPETNNASGFSAYPAGGYFGAFQNSGSIAGFWSSTKDDDELVWRWYLYNDNSCLVRCDFDEGDGISVRCVHD